MAKVTREKRYDKIEALGKRMQVVVEPDGSLYLSGKDSCTVSSIFLSQEEAMDVIDLLSSILRELNFTNK